MLREVLRLTKGDLSNVTRPLHVKKKAQPNEGKMRKIALPLSQCLKQKLQEAKDALCHE